MKKFIFIFIILINFVLLYAADLQVNVDKVIGTVKIAKSGASSRTVLKPGDSVSQNDVITTYFNSKLTLTIENKAKLVINENSTVDLKTLQYDPATGDYKADIKMWIGKIQTKVNKLSSENSKFTVSTPTAVCGVRGTQFTVNVDEDGKTTLGVKEGSVELAPIQNQAKSVLVEKQQVTQSDGLSASQPKSLDAKTQAELFSENLETSSAPDNNIKPQGSELTLQQPADNTTSAKLNLLVQEPKNNIVTKSANVTVRGTIEPVNAELFVNGNKILNNKGNFSTDIILNEGKNNIKITARDIVKNEEISNDIQIVVDTQKPNIKIIKKTIDDLGNIEIIGATEPDAEVIINNKYTIKSNETGAFNKKFKLESGTSIEIEVRDKAGWINNSSEDISGIIDQLPPVLSSITIQPENASAGQLLNINISFQDNSDIKNNAYLIISGPNNYSRKIQLSKIDKTNFTVNFSFETNVKNGSYLISSVFAEDAKNNSIILQPNKSITVINEPPLVISGIKAEALPEGKCIILSWDMLQENDIAGYKIFRANTPNGPFTQTALVSSNSYMDKSVENNSAYYYYVSAIDYANQQGKNSAIVSAISKNLTKPMPPQMLSAEKISNGIHIEWAPSQSQDIAGYYIYVIENNMPIKIGQTNSTTISFNHNSGLQPNKTYNYAVSAIGLNSKESEKSNILSVKW
ncbi:FecR domain-containing protein [Candidatus Dependentiae bacterium]|nr:FecR domain-containing protein [Candidatus Dependentiae bacterium]